MSEDRPVVLLFLVLAVFLADAAEAELWPAQVLVVANLEVPAGVDLATYYMERRGIPGENLLRISAPRTETCTREEYRQHIAVPVQQRLREPGSARLRAVVLCFGVPLRVAPPVPAEAERTEIGSLEAERKDLQGGLHPEEEGELAARETRLKEISARLRSLRRVDHGASVDSELMLARVEDVPVAGWVANPAYRGATRVTGGINRRDVLIVSRLDGPTTEVARRLVDDALAAEMQGLSGGAYLDARWPEPPTGREVKSYALYDRSLYRTAEILRRRGWAVHMDETQELFPAGAALPAGLYCGWYRLGRYVDAFQWQQGAVGYHIASSEAVTLRSGDSQVWCKRMLEEGIAATLGPVAEPYLHAFPPPELFFDLLTRGVFTLGEVYRDTLPILSWQMVLIGDPLYRPFRAIKR